MPNNFLHYVASASLLFLGLISSVPANVEIVPLEANATFSGRATEKTWSTVVKSVEGKTEYILLLEPDFDVRRHVVTVELLLRRPNDKDNLLDPTRNRHGLQPYDFVANDLSHGVQNSAFGTNRTISAKDLGIVVHMTVLDATVKPISQGNYELDRLALRIKVDNAGP